MKLLRYGELGAEKPGILDPQGVVRDLSQVVRDIEGDVLAKLGRWRGENVSVCPPGCLKTE